MWRTGGVTDFIPVLMGLSKVASADLTQSAHSGCCCRTHCTIVIALHCMILDYAVYLWLHDSMQF